MADKKPAAPSAPRGGTRERPPSFAGGSGPSGPPGPPGPPPAMPGGPPRRPPSASPRTGPPKPKTQKEIDEAIQEAIDKHHILWEYIEPKLPKLKKLPLNERYETNKKRDFEKHGHYRRPIGLIYFTCFFIFIVFFLLFCVFYDPFCKQTQKKKINCDFP